jgi:hypothetical protein
MITVTLLFYLQSNTNDATPIFCCGGFILVVVLIIFSLNSAGKQQAKVLAAARDAYFNSLIKLKANPTSADLRQTTLQLGRTYSNLTRSNKGVTIFDEVALSNDISAACAGATNIHENKVPKPDQTIELRLERLAELKAKGLIDDDEYAARREKILDEV